MKIRILYLILLSLVVAGLILRFWGIWHGSFAFTYDVGRDLLAVKNIVENHKISLIGATSGQMGIFYGPWWTWILIVPYLLSSGDPSFIAYFMALCGLCSMVLIYLWGLKYLGFYFASASSAIIAFSQYFISTSVQIWNPNLLIPVTVLILILHSRVPYLKNWQFFLLGFLLMLAVELEFVFGLFLLSGYLLVFLLWRRLSIGFKNTLFIVTGALIIELPRILFEIRHGFLQTNTLLHFFSGQGMESINLNLRLRYLWEKWLEVLPPLNSNIMVIITLVIILLITCGYRIKLKEQIRIFVRDINVIVLVFILLTLIYPKDFWDYYLLGLPVFFAFYIGLAFYFIKSLLSKKMFLLTICVYILFLIRPANIISGFKNPYFQGDAAVYRNQITAIDYVYREAEYKDFNYIAYTPPLIEYTWNYLFSWYGRKKYGYEPKITREETFFVIIEPDPGFEGRVAMWLKVREGDGKVIKEKRLPSGIIVQTRLRPKEI